ncbi:DUF3298 and DUF4163 domain-containing protein [Bacillus sp. FSL W8-0848]|uniref:DUF3298 and DUF4163 domain-containing protein n=1 Tax=Bacillus sp. FSL W8-0848 TaxID=2954634 RepID=UPI0030F61643
MSIQKAMAVLGFLVLTALLLFTINKSSSLINASPNKKASVYTEVYKGKESLSYPKFSDLKDKYLKMINDAIGRHMEASYKEYEMLKKEADQSGGESAYETSYKVNYNDGDRLSFFIYDYQYTGGAHGVYTATSYNYDLNEHRRITLLDVLNNQAKIEKAKNYIFSYINKHSEQFYSDLKKSDIRLDQDTAFYFTDSGISIVFQQYDIGPSSSGNQEIKIPSSFLY